MIFIPKKNIYFPNCKWGMKKYQKGILHPIGFWAAAVISDVIDLRNMDAFFEDDFDVFARCQLYGESHAREGEQWHNDGSFNLVFQNDTITPASSTDDYQMKWVALLGDTPASKSVAANTWESLDLDSFYVEWQADFDEESGGSVTVSIRKGTGSVIDTAIWSGEAIAYKKW